MQKVKLKEVCTLINGRAYKQEELLDSGKYPVLRVGNFFSDKGYYYSDLELEEDKYCDSGDLLFAWSASFGPKIWNGGKVIYHYHIWKMVLEDSVNKEYLYYYLYYLSERIKAEGHGGIMIHTTKAEMEERELSLPDMSKQCEIAKVLNQLSAIIEKRQTEIKELDNLIKARFVELFGDYHTNSKGFECHTGSELFKFSSGKFLPEERRLDAGVPVYGGNGIAWYTDEALIDYPTVIIGRVGAWCGNVHTVLEPVWITDNAIFIKEQKTDKFTLEFLTEMMKVMDFHQYADFSGQPKITQKPLESLNYLTPPVEMQNEFTDFVKQVDKSKVVKEMRNK